MASNSDKGSPQTKIQEGSTMASNSDKGSPQTKIQEGSTMASNSEAMARKFKATLKDLANSVSGSLKE
jgi:hypothetical protein